MTVPSETFDRDPRIRRVILELCEARGYSDIRCEKNFVLATESSLGSILCMSLKTKGAAKVCTSDIMEFIRTLNTHKVDHGIMVFEEATLNSVHVASLLRSPSVELLARDTVIVNPTKHRLVPRHTLATAAQVGDLAARGVKHKTLPTLLLSDPIARFYAFPSGSVVHIEREGLEGHGNDLNVYRVVR